MQLVLGVGRRFVVLATLDNVVLSFEIVFLHIIQAKLLLLPVSGGHLVLTTLECIVLAFGIALLSSI